MAFDLASAPPLLQEYGKSQDTAPTAPTTTPDPKIPEKDAKAPDATPAPTPGEMPNTAKGAEAALSGIQKLEQERNKFEPPKADLPKQPKNIQEGMTLWGGLAIAFAALASKRTRTPMTTAMNAMAAAYKGVQEGNAEKFEHNYKQWEMDMKLATESYNLQRDAYNDVMSRIDRSENTLVKTGELEDREEAAKMKALTMSFDDPIAMDTYQKSGIQGLKDLQKQRDVQKERMTKFTEANRQGAQVGIAMQFLEKDPTYQRAVAAGDQQTVIAMRAQVFHQFVGKTPAAPGAEGAGAVDPETLGDMVDRVGKYGENWQDAVKGYSTRGNARGDVTSKLFAGLKEKFPDWTPVNEHLIAKARDDLNTGPISKNIVALGTLPKHLDSLEKEVAALPDDAGATALTRVFQLFEKQYSPELAQYGVGAKAVSAEFAAALAGSGKPGISERAEGVEDLTSAKSKEMLLAEIKTMKELAGSRAAEIREQYKRVPDIDSYFPEGLLKAYKPDGKEETTPDKSGAADEKPDATPTAEKVGAGKPPEGSKAVSVTGPDGKPATLHLQNGKWFKEDGMPAE